MTPSKFALYFFTKNEADFLKQLEGCLYFQLNPVIENRRMYGVYDRRNESIAFYSNLKKACNAHNIEYQAAYFQIQGRKGSKGKGFFSENGVTIIKHHLE